MPARGNFIVDQMEGYPNDNTKFLAGKKVGGANQWLKPPGNAQSLSASGSKFIESYDASTGLFVARRPTEADLSISDITTNNVTSAAHGLAPKSPADATQFLSGAATPAYAAVKDSDLSTSDITTNNASTSKHGFVPKLPNDATKFYDGTGSYSVPSGGGGGSGALVLLESHVASSSASLDFTTRNASGQSGATFQSDYDDYMVRLVDVIPANSAVDLLFRVSTNGGSSYQTGTDYYWGWNYVPNVGGAGIVQGSSVTSITLFTSVSNTVDYGGVSGTFNAFNPGSSTRRKSFTYQVVASQSGAVYVGNGSGTWGAIGLTTAIDAFRFFFSSGNIASGTIRLYGVAK